jgi:hypothetical protein
MSEHRSGVLQNGTGAPTGSQEMAAGFWAGHRRRPSLSQSRAAGVAGDGNGAARQGWDVGTRFLYCTHTSTRPRILVAPPPALQGKVAGQPSSGVVALKLNEFTLLYPNIRDPCNHLRPDMRRRAATDFYTHHAAAPDEQQDSGGFGAGDEFGLGSDNDAPSCVMGGRRTDGAGGAPPTSDLGHCYIHPWAGGWWVRVAGGCERAWAVGGAYSGFLVSVV